MKRIMKHIFSLLALFMAGIFMAGCTDELAVTGTSTATGAFTPKGEVVDAYLELTVSNLSVSASTRDVDIDTEDTEAERQVDNIWVFQYDNSDDCTTDADRKLITAPQYIIIEEQPILQNVPVKLSDNDGAPSIVYVVTNTSSDSWGAPDANYTGFATLAELKQQALPTREPIWETDDDLSIPMGGSNGEEDELIVESEKVVTVPVQRMYAKVMIDVQINLNQAYIYNVGIGNIPQYCRVESLSDDVSDDSEAFIYPDNITWISRTFQNKEEGDKSTVYTVYVPENLQGEQDTDSKLEDLSGKAFAVNVALSCEDEQGGVMQYPYTVYPGKDILKDYNIKRNVIYYITMNISTLSEARVPSANSFAVVPGETLAFYPYYREEKGGGYDFTTYLDPDDETGEKKISTVEIIWQTPDCIGDNSDDENPLVWISPNEATHTGYEKIYVKANEDGNALIAARNYKGDIIWSWHIWVTENDPTNEANALTYYTYDWDENGIYTDHRVSGYQIMNCNLGALHNTPIDDDDLPNTYGMLYQWGRKDPFPPLTQHGYTSGGGYWAHDYTEETTQVLYGNDNETKVLKTASDDTSCLFHSIAGSTINDESDGITYTIQNPTVFMCGTDKVCQSIDESNTLIYVQTLSNYSNKGAWSDDDHDNKLWGGLDFTDPSVKSYALDIFYRDEDNEEVTEEHENYENYRIHIYDNYGSDKSIFDPCPYGWRVSSNDLWLGFSDTGSNPTSMEDVNYNASISSAEGLYMYLGQEWQSGETSFFPCQGFRVADGCGYRVSACGNYSNANTDANDRVNIIHIHNNALYFKIFEPQTGYTVKSTANPVRCVRDKK